VSQSELRYSREKSSEPKQVNQSFVDSTARREEMGDYSFRTRSEQNKVYAPTMRSFEVKAEKPILQEVNRNDNKPPQELFDSETDSNIMQRVLTTLESFAHSSVKEEDSGNSAEISKKLAELKMQHEKDNKLFEQLIEEQKAKIRQLETELMHLSENNNKLQIKNEQLKNSLNIESDKVNTTEAKSNKQSKEIGELRKENERLKETCNRTEKSLEETLKLFKSLLNTFIKSLNFLFTSNTEYQQPLINLKNILINKVKTLVSSIPSLDFAYEINLVIYVYRGIGGELEGEEEASGDYIKRFE
jgi:chromosome segregation ATPase